MNRHHPYGGNFDGHRRGGSPSGPGPDRAHRFQERGGGGYRGRGGYGRGRAGGRGGGGEYGVYEGGIPGGYDQGSDVDAYNEYDSQAPPQNSFYQNTGPYASYNQGYGKYEDVAANGYDDDGGGYSRGQRRPIRKDRDDKVHDSIIEERIQRERPCRTLFIRNIKYETNSDDVRRQFEEFGDIKTFFDLISTRGMVFVTYFDLRAAERARDRLQGSEISGRPIDVHYSLPRDDQKGPERERNQQFQGTLQVTLRASPSGQPIDDNEIRRKFQAFGDIKSIRPVNDRIDSRYVEFYDTRNCDDAFSALRHQGLQDGVMDIVYAWDHTEGLSEGRYVETFENISSSTYIQSAQTGDIVIGMVLKDIEDAVAAVEGEAVVADVVGTKVGIKITNGMIDVITVEIVILRTVAGVMMMTMVGAVEGEVGMGTDTITEEVIVAALVATILRLHLLSHPQ
ncbi:Protein MEI2-like 2 [Leucoagaricus sp. SymC.cos]|nr:Protein MEI2-like 2 [Leucoagaricus sp. SymC.cos]